jgi:hypothetical protein
MEENLQPLILALDPETLKLILKHTAILKVSPSQYVWMLVDQGERVFQRVEEDRAAAHARFQRRGW